MDSPRQPEPLRRRAEELAARPALEQVREFLNGFVNDEFSLDDVRAGLRRLAAGNTRGLKRYLRALDELLATPQPPGVLAGLAAWDANWRLDDPSDAGAAVLLRQLAELLREVVTEADEERMRRYRGAGA